MHSCNAIAEAFVYKTKGYNGCVITLRLSNKNVDERDSFYHLAYYARSNYKLVLGSLNKSFFFDNATFRVLCYHDSAWRHDSYNQLESIWKDGAYRKISIEEITPVNWVPIECSISSNRNELFSVQVSNSEGRIKIKEDF